jgi:hypothetical protein
MHGSEEEKPEWKRLLRRCISRWEDNIKVEFREIGWDVHWIHLAQNSDQWRCPVNIVMNLLVS